MAFGISFDVQNIFALRWFDEYTFDFAEQVAEVTRGVLEDVIRQAIAEGAGIQQAQNRIETLMEQWATGKKTPEDFRPWFEERMPAYRAELIARTETIRARNKGAEEQYKAWGIRYKEWWTNFDERTCPFCKEMHLKRFVIGHIIWSKGQVMNVQMGDKTHTLKFDYEDVTGPPLHPNCRCTLLPWKEEWAEWDARREAEETE